MTNPLLESYDLAPFSRIKPEHIKPAIDQTLQQSKQAIMDLLESLGDPSWENLMQPIEQLSNTLDKRWSPVSHMNSVVNSDELRKAYDACLPLLSEYGTWLGQNEKLYQAVQALYDRREELGLNSTQVKILEDELRDFKLAGVSLSDDKKKRYGDIQKRLSELSSKYEQNLLDATMAWSEHFANEKGLEGLPESTMALLKQNAENAKQSGYLLNLEFPCYFAVMSYADDGKLREEMYRAYATRASEFSDQSEWNNAPIMDERGKPRGK